MKCQACGFVHRPFVLESVDNARHETMHLKAFPGVDQRTRDNLRMLVTMAAEREAAAEQAESTVLS